MGTVAIARLVTIAMALAMLPGCCGFHRQWNEFRCCASTGTGLDGLWEGTWESHVNGHRGSLRAIISPCASGGGYHARFFAIFWEVLPFDFSLPLAAMPAAAGVEFQGEADLGCLAGGLYTCQGTADECCFQARYCSKNDHGVFVMRRIQ